jgi:hypothetical protein
VSIIKLETRLLEKFKSSPFSVNDLNEQVKIIAPKFLDVDSILNYVSVAPLIINLAAAVFCFGCSAAFHLWSVKSA